MAINRSNAKKEVILLRGQLCGRRGCPAALREAACRSLMTAAPTEAPISRQPSVSSTTCTRSLRRRARSSDVMRWAESRTTGRTTRRRRRPRCAGSTGPGSTSASTDRGHYVQRVTVVPGIRGELPGHEDRTITDEPCQDPTHHRRMPPDPLEPLSTDSIGKVVPMDQGRCAAELTAVGADRPTAARAPARRAVSSRRRWRSR